MRKYLRRQHAAHTASAAAVGQQHTLAAAPALHGAGCAAAQVYQLHTLAAGGAGSGGRRVRGEMAGAVE